MNPYRQAREVENDALGRMTGPSPKEVGWDEGFAAGRAALPDERLREALRAIVADFPPTPDRDMDEEEVEQWYADHGDWFQRLSALAAADREKPEVLMARISDRLGGYSHAGDRLAEVVARVCGEGHPALAAWRSVSGSSEPRPEKKCRAPHCWSEYGTPCGDCPSEPRPENPMSDKRPTIEVHAEVPTPDAVRTFYEVPDAVASQIGVLDHKASFVENLVSLLADKAYAVEAVNVAAIHHVDKMRDLRDQHNSETRKDCESGCDTHRTCREDRGPCTHGLTAGRGTAERCLECGEAVGEPRPENPYPENTPHHTGYALGVAASAAWWKSEYDNLAAELGRVRARQPEIDRLTSAFDAVVAERDEARGEIAVIRSKCPHPDDLIERAWALISEVMVLAKCSQTSEWLIEAKAWQHDYENGAGNP